LADIDGRVDADPGLELSSSVRTDRPDCDRTPAYGFAAVSDPDELTLEPFFTPGLALTVERSLTLDSARDETWDALSLADFSACCFALRSPASSFAGTDALLELMS
jgi:hypothetical protein